MGGGGENVPAGKRTAVLKSVPVRSVDREIYVIEAVGRAPNLANSWDVISALQSVRHGTFSEPVL